MSKAVIFFPNLPKEAQLKFLFGPKRVQHKKRLYTYLGQRKHEPARYSIKDVK